MINEVEEARDRLLTLIANHEIERAITFVRNPEGLFLLEKLEAFVFVVLRQGREYAELVEAVLESFLSVRENSSPEHGHWVHSLSHFTEILWEHRMDNWIQRFNKVAFRGALELDDPNCINRLGEDFVENANWDDDPTDFHITLEVIENMEFFDSDYEPKYLKARVREGSLESQQAFLQWLVEQAESYDSSDASEIQTLVRKAGSIVHSTEDISGKNKSLLVELVGVLENKAASVDDDYRQSILEDYIQDIQQSLTE